MPRWSETDSADNAVALATHAADSRQKHTLKGVAAGYAAADDLGTLTVTVGTTVVLVLPVHAGKVVVVPLNIQTEADELVSAELTASGGAADLGYVNIWGDNAGTVLT